MLRQASHTLKFSSAISATNLAPICQELETLNRSQSFSNSHTEDGLDKPQLQAEYE